MTSAVAEPLSLQPIQNHAPAVRPGPAGPGWFDSSWELRAGLQVEEGLPADLPLHGWIEAWLRIVGGSAGGSLPLGATWSAGPLPQEGRPRAARTASPSSTTASA